MRTKTKKADHTYTNFTELVHRVTRPGESEAFQRLGIRILLASGRVRTTPDMATVESWLEMLHSETKYVFWSNDLDTLDAIFLVGAVDRQVTEVDLDDYDEFFHLLWHAVASPNTEELLGQLNSLIENREIGFFD